MLHPLRKYLLLAIGCIIFFINDASALSCRNFEREARASIGSSVAALQRIEFEAADRVKGLDSRPFEYLLGEARKRSEIIADPAALKLEEGLERCRNWTRPIRKICAEAARALVEVLEKHVAAPKPDYDRPRYAATMQECEKLMDLKPLTSGIRTAE